MVGSQQEINGRADEEDEYQDRDEAKELTRSLNNATGGFVLPPRLDASSQISEGRNRNRNTVTGTGTGRHSM